MPFTPEVIFSLAVFGQRATGQSVAVGSTVLWELACQNPTTRLPVDLTSMAVIMALSAVDPRGNPIRPAAISRQATITDVHNGLCQVPWAAGDTAPIGAPLAPGDYAIEVWLEDSSGNRLQTLLYGIFTLTPAGRLPSDPITPLPSQAPLALGPVGPQGPVGPTGPTGPAGVSEVHSIGTTGSPQQLRAVSGTADGQVIIASGFWSRGDGGGGAFVWDALSTAADDGGVVIQPTGQITGRWRRAYDTNGYVNVRWFGAKGNAAPDTLLGGQDDYFAFQAGLNYLYSLFTPGTSIFSQTQAGTLYAPSGNYRLSQTLNLKKQVNLVGDGAGFNTLLIFNDQAFGVYGHVIDGITILGGDGVNPLSVLDGTGSRVANLTLFGSGNVNTPFSALVPLPMPNDWDPLVLPAAEIGHPYTAGSGIVCRTTCVIENVSIQSFKYDGINVSSNVYYNANGVNIKYAIIQGCGRHGIFFMGENANGCTTFGCNIANCRGWGIFDRSFLGNLHEGNQVAECGFFVTTVGALLVDPLTTISNEQRGLYLGSDDGGAYYNFDYQSVDWRADPIGLENVTDPTLANDSLTCPVTALAADYFNAPYVIYAASGQVYGGLQPGGVFVRANPLFVETWSQSNTGLTDTDVRALAVDPGHVYAGTHTGGVFLSGNQGASWVQSNAGLNSLDVRALVVDPANVGTVYAGTHGGGVFKSSNSGGGWTGVNVGLSHQNVISLALVAGVLYAGTSDGYVYKSTNGGSSWSQVFLEPSGYQINALAVDPSSNANVYAATGDGSSSGGPGHGAGVYKSANAGGSWAQANTGLADPSFLIAQLNVRSLAVSPTGVVYCGVQALATFHPSSNGGGVFISTNQAGSWAMVGNGPRYGGGYFSQSGGTNQSTFVGCYDEADSPSRVQPPSMILGGVATGSQAPTAGGLVLSGSLGLTGNLRGLVFDKVFTFVAHASQPLVSSDNGRVILIDTSLNLAEVLLTDPSTQVGRRLLVKKTNSGGGYVDVRATPSTIDGGPDFFLFAQDSWVELEAAATEWKIIGQSGAQIDVFPTGGQPPATFVRPGYMYLDTTTHIVYVSDGSVYTAL